MSEEDETVAFVPLGHRAESTGNSPKDAVH